MKITHEQARKYVLNYFPILAEQTQIMRYFDQQEKADIFLQKNLELLGLYREVWKDDIENNLPAEQYIELVNKLIKAEEELRGSESK